MLPLDVTHWNLLWLRWCVLCRGCRARKLLRVQRLDLVQLPCVAKCQRNSRDVSVTALLYFVFLYLERDFVERIRGLLYALPFLLITPHILLFAPINLLSAPQWHIPMKNTETYWAYSYRKTNS
jgi:hypothetical protein